MSAELTPGPSKTTASFFPSYAPVVSSSEDRASELTSTLNSPNNATLTVRIIKSFPYRSMKALVLKGVDLEKPNGVDELMNRCKKEIPITLGFKPFKTSIDKLDTIKLYTKAHGHKTMNLIINFEDDETDILSPGTEATLASYGIENETELSFFNREEYEAFKLNPELKWA
ncbi:Uncharacterized conserved protein [Phaffia rhodozyma]|uniref:Uncharacterized conserved protein n=1 Tax=Phaffia rhodozyma TaxID=264483 RepID=A0A0F7SHG5_PHARH|nr:Uncharacterized conserved protein [Phaffia rhodozyma]